MAVKRGKSALEKIREINEKAFDVGKAAIETDKDIVSHAHTLILLQLGYVVQAIAELAEIVSRVNDDVND